MSIAKSLKIVFHRTPPVAASKEQHISLFSDVIAGF